MSVSTEDRFAPPEAHVADVVAPASDEVLAGRGTRFVAALLDALILWTLMTVVMKLVPVLGELASMRGDRMSLMAWNLPAVLVGLPLFLIVQSWLLVKRGQTLGKMICKLRIVRSDGSAPDAWRLLGLRYGIGFLMNSFALTSLVYGLIDALLIFRESRKCLHDTIADTKVIKL
ncbi:RDD family protein [Roseateles sp.]|uniref:RDD family protein n=1 Tax=Roseateles sp. TaxID=1971397 RepID=UPI002F417E87